MLELFETTDGVLFVFVALLYTLCRVYAQFASRSSRYSYTFLERASHDGVSTLCVSYITHAFVQESYTPILTHAPSIKFRTIPATTPLGELSQH